MPRLAYAAAGAALLGLLGGCTVGPDYQAPKPELPAAFVAQPAADGGKATGAGKPAAVDVARWWESFHDPELISLIERAIAGNLDFQIALARLQEAETFEAVVIGTSLPEIGASGAAGTGTGTDLTRGKLAPALGAADNRNGAQVVQAVGFDGGWELDLFGKLRREAEASGYDAEAASEARNETLVTLVADVARAYFDVRGLQMRLAALERSTAAAAQTVDYVQARFDRGLTNELDLTLAKREQASLAAEIAPLRAQVRAATYSIAVLIGAYPEIVDKELAKPALLPSLPAAVDAGLPVDLLRRRPDIRQAERELAGQTARIGVATANLFPAVGVTGAVGWQELSVAKSVSPLIWAAGPQASWSLLDFGTLDALVDIADLRTREALLSYRQTVLRAVQQVDTAVDDYAAEQDSLHNLDDALVASQRSVTLAAQRYDRGLTDFLNVLDAQRQEYQLEDQYAATEQAAADALVGLYKGLGGGWEGQQSTPPIRQPQPAVVAAFTRLFAGDSAGK
jgi:NodT family efflux transporter outer membrane factor (OMF) lipoprotein